MRLATLLAAALLSVATAQAATPPPASADLVRAIVTYKQLPPGIASELNLMQVNGAGVVEGAVIPTINSVSLTAPRALLQLLAQDSRVLAIRPQRKIKFNLYGSVDQINARGVELAEMVGPEACAKSRPGVTGAGVTVAVIDSGVHAAHPALLGRVLTGLNFEGSLPQRETGVVSAEEADAYAVATGPSALQDEVGHGTHCAGTVGGDGTGGAGLNLAGVAPGVEIISMKIASGANGVVADAGFEANAVRAIDYLTRHQDTLGSRIASNSWGLLAEEEQAILLGPTDFDPVKAVVKAAVDAGIVMVFSAGNDGGGLGDNTVRAFPNAMDEVITVGSACKASFGSCPAGEMNDFSSRGPSVDISAPGDQILSAQAPNSILAPIGQTLEGDYFGDSPQDEAQNRANYMRLSGTSMSAPHIAGVVALLLEANPDLTPAEVREILTTTATDMVVDGHAELVAGFDEASGFGLVNVRKALGKAVGAPVEGLCPATGTPPVTDPTPPQPPVVTPTPTPAPAVAVDEGRFGGGSLAPLSALLLLAVAALRRRTARTAVLASLLALSPAMASAQAIKQGLWEQTIVLDEVNGESKGAIKKKCITAEDLANLKDQDAFLKSGMKSGKLDPSCALKSFVSTSREISYDLQCKGGSLAAKIAIESPTRTRTNSRFVSGSKMFKSETTDRWLSEPCSESDEE